MHGTMTKTIFHNSACSSVGSLEQPSPSALSFVSSPESASSPSADVVHPASTFSVLNNSFQTSTTLPVVDEQQQISPLTIANPCCYKSPVIQRRMVANGTIHSHHQHTYDLQNPSATTRVPVLANGGNIPRSPPPPPPHISSLIQLLQNEQQQQLLPTHIANKQRTVSMQTVGTECFYPMGASFGFINDHSSAIVSRASSTQLLGGFPESSDNNTTLCDQRIPIELQTVSIIDWLNDVSFSKLDQLFRQHSADPLSGSNRWYKRVQMVKNLRSVIRQVKDKAQLSFNGAAAIATADVSPAGSNSLYGMPLGHVQASTADGSPLPRFVHDMMAWLANQAQCSDGIFRKNGVKVRIVEIKEACSRLAADQPIPGHLLSESASNDVADALKQYFRELPECLMTDRISALVEGMVAELPEDTHFLALQYCTLMLPSEHREALVVLLRFLNGITRHSPTNQMTSGCVATCWMPTLFRFTHFAINGGAESNNNNGAVGRRQLARRKTIGMPNERERRAYEAIKRMLTMMIDRWEQLLYLPTGLAREVNRSRREVCHDLEMPMKNGQFDFSEELQRHFRQQLHRLKEDYLSGWKNWDLQRVYPDGSQLFTRAINDMIPLKAFRVQTSIAASPQLIFNAILNSRHLWDSQVRECRRIGPSGQNFHILKLTYGTMFNSRAPPKYTFMARRWWYSANGRSGDRERDGGDIAMLAERSIVPRNVWRTQYAGNGNISIYKSEFLVVSVCPGHSYVIYISRADFRGKSSDWYDKVYGGMLVQHLQCLKRHIFRCQNGFQARGTIV